MSRKVRFRLAYLLLFVCLFSWPTIGSAAVTAQRDLPTVDYEISVSLDDQISTLSGEETIIWTNPGTVATAEMYLHLYPNAFRQGSTFIKESGGSLRGDRQRANEPGEMTLQLLQSGGHDLAWQYVQPDDQNQADQTLVRVSLPSAISPGKSVRLNLRFSVRLPQVFARMGKLGQFVMAGQWFPKVAVYEPVGIRGRTIDGWDTHQYHGNTEFYADFGHYRVAITVPASHTVAATGQAVGEPQLVNGRRQYIFEADRVHDFVWATDSDFVRSQATFQSEHQPPVQVQLYLQPEHAGRSEEYFRAANETLGHLAEWLGPYPYPVLSLVCPTAGANGAGGMEYPMLVTGWSGDTPAQYSLATVLVHEIIHQYFYGLVASNEFEEAWLDEGFTSYFEDKVMQASFGREISPAEEAAMITRPESLVLPGWKYSSARAYQENAYVRGKLVLHEFERRIGWQTMQTAMRQYVKQYSFKHPDTADFQRVLQQVSGRDFTQFFADCVYAGGMQDLRIGRVKSQLAEQGYDTSVVLVQPRTDSLSVRLVASYADGSHQEFTIPLAQLETEFVWQHPAKLTQLELDPEPAQVVLDNRRANNRYQTSILQSLRLVFAQLFRTLTRLFNR